MLNRTDMYEYIYYCFRQVTEITGLNKVSDVIADITSKDLEPGNEFNFSLRFMAYTLSFGNSFDQMFWRKNGTYALVFFLRYIHLYKVTSQGIQFSKR